MSQRDIQPASPIPSGEIANGVRVRRRVIYQAPVTKEGWYNEMVAHIAVAKTLGFTAFEIDVTPEQQKARRGMGFYFSIFGQPGRVEGDEWKDADDEDRKARTVDVPVVTILALVVE